MYLLVFAFKAFWQLNYTTPTVLTNDYFLNFLNHYCFFRCFYRSLFLVIQTRQQVPSLLALWLQSFLPYILLIASSLLVILVGLDLTSITLVLTGLQLVLPPFQPPFAFEPVHQLPAIAFQPLLLYAQLVPQRPSLIYTPQLILPYQVSIS